jgi:hypothetical protein
VSTTCRLCGRNNQLQLSHIIPRFAVKWVKDTSATGYLKSPYSNKRLQESERVHLLCRDCEQLLAVDEKQFCERIFIPYHEQGQRSFQYENWLKKFLVGLHWRVLATRENTERTAADIVYSRFEQEWKRFLLGESTDAGPAEFHMFFADVISDSSGPMPEKINWYLARGCDLTPTFSDSGSAGSYAKLVKIITVAFLTRRNVEDERWEGTLVEESGFLRTPQSMRTASFGPFIEERARNIESASRNLTARQTKKLLEIARREPERMLASETYRTFLADGQMRRRRLNNQSIPIKGRDRNQPCRCESGLKYKKCCGR